MVLKEDKTTKFRLTLDCKIVNDLLLSGKLLLRPVFDVYTEFRCAPVAISLDLKAMYYCIEYFKNVNIFQFLSQDPCNANSPIQNYSFIRSCMGDASTQFLALMFLNKIAEKSRRSKLIQSC